MIFYVLLFLIILEIIIFKLTNFKRKKEAFMIITFVLMYAVLLLRNNSVGLDTSVYYNIFNRLAYDTSSSFEPITQLLFMIGRFLGNNFKVTQFLFEFTTLSLVFWVIYKKSSNVYLSVIIYVTYLFYFFSFSAMRQMLGIAIVFYGVTFLEKRLTLKFVICVVIAYLVHSSLILAMVILIPYYFKIVYNKSIFVGFLLMCAVSTFVGKEIVGILTNTFLASKYEFYLYSDVYGSEGGSLLTAFFSLALLAFCVLYVKKEKAFSANNYLYWMFSIGVLIRFMARDFLIANRAGFIFLIFAVLLFPNIVSLKSYHKTTITIVVGIVFLSFGVIQIMRSYYGITPYSFMWQ